MHIHLDILGGIAGDMFIAALLDAWPEHADGTLAAIRAAGLPADWDVGVDAHRDHLLGGRQFRVSEARASPRGGHGDSHAGHEGHTSHRAIVKMLRAAPLEPAVASRALEIFELLARAEAEVHGVEPADVTFHEVGAWDSVADIVGAAYLLHRLQPRSWSTSAIPLGSGRVATSHGPLPVPAPATAILLQGFPVFDDGIPGERVTPTGAALLAHLRQSVGEPQRAQQPRRLSRRGAGFGTRILPGLSNVLRILALDDVAPAHGDDTIGVVEFEVDDQTPEDLATGIESLRELPGVLDVLLMPATGKKGRMVSHVRLLCRRDVLPIVTDACFTETATIGLRWSVAARVRLERESRTVNLEGREVSVKLTTRPDGTTSAKADMDDVKGTGGRAGRERRRRRAQAAAIGRGTEE
jgi:uncharacterized protein (TIGR00299 family) protein